MAACPLLVLPLLLQPSGAVRVLQARGAMLQPAFGDCVLGPTARLCSRALFVTPPPNQIAEDALAAEIYNNLLSRYGPSNGRENGLIVAQSERDADLLGACGVNVERQTALDTELVPVLANLVVDPRARRQGIAKRLVKACEALARGWGYRTLYLKVEEANAPAQRLYEKLGYRVVQIDSRAEIPRGSSGMFGGSVAWVSTSLVVMEKDLDAGFRIPFLPFLDGFFS
jgi:GNAT superfamily N-acetyltransferase